MSTSIIIDVSDLDEAFVRLRPIFEFEPSELMTAIGALGDSQTRRRIEEEKTAPDGTPVCPNNAGGQATYAFDKVKAAILSLGGREEDVVRTRIYLRHTADWEVVSVAHARAFGAARPANTLIGGIDLIGPYAIEVEAEVEIGEIC